MIFGLTKKREFYVIQLQLIIQLYIINCLYHCHDIKDQGRKFKPLHTIFTTQKKQITNSTEKTHTQH